MKQFNVRAPLPDEVQVAQAIAIKAASDIATQAEFASMDAKSADSLNEAAKRFDAILHYAERALSALDRLHSAGGPRHSVQ